MLSATVRVVPLWIIHLDRQSAARNIFGMPQLSQRASELVHEIARARSRPPAKKLALMRLLRELAGLDEPNAAPYILAEYLYEAVLDAADVAALLARLASRLSTESLLGLERERMQSDAWYGPVWLQPLDRMKEFFRAPGGWAAFAFASFSRNGYLREHAVRALNDLLNDGREIPFLALRTADFVPQVARAATAALAARFTPKNADSFVLALPLLRHLDAYRVRKQASLLAWVLTFLSSADGWPALRGGLVAVDRAVRRECFNLALSLDARRQEAARLALTDSDPVIRLRAFRVLDSRGAQPECAAYPLGGSLSRIAPRS